MHHRTTVVAATAASLAALILTGCSAQTLDPAPVLSSSTSHPQGGVTVSPASHPQGGVQTGARGTATVERVVDGDTIIATSDGQKQRVRVLGIDTPETVHPDKPVECYGPEASAFAHQLLDGQTVTLRSDPTQDKVDHYGRELRYVILPDGQNYSIVAAQQGMAKAYVYDDNPVREAPAIQTAADQAQQEKVGMWGSC